MKPQNRGRMSTSDPPAVSAPEPRLLRKQANQLLQRGQPYAALALLDQALSCDPADPAAHSDRGNVLQDLQRPIDAIASYDRALQINPQLPATLTNRGNAWRSLGRLDEALADQDAALRLRPAFPEALNNRGNVLRDLGRLEEALHCFDAATALRPGFVMAWSNRGKALLDLQHPSMALVSFENALTYAADDGEALFGHASALLQLGRELERAAAEFDRVAERGIDRAETLVGMAAALAGLERHGEAAACVSELLRLAPEWEYARGGLIHSRLQAVDWMDLSGLMRELFDRIRRGDKATHPHSLLSLTDRPELQLACARVVAAHKYPENGSLGACPSASARAAGKIRVAYVSADFCEHPVSYLLIGTLERHDREHFELIGVPLRKERGGAFERRVRGTFDRLVDVAERGDREVAAALRALQVDIAVDLTGFTEGLRLGIFAHRAAPVQVSYLGYAGTLGAPYMDYLVADEVVIPPGEERWYAERVVRLPHCYLPNDDRREIAAAPTRKAAGLPEQGLVLCAFTKAYKINPPVFDVWMRVLRQVSGSVLWLRASGEEARANLAREARARGVDSQRLIFAPPVSSAAEHLGRHGLADLYLDTLPYNAHSTACDALWAGVPVLTCAGRSMASRVAASALNAAGLPELITHSLEDYERRALQLAQDTRQLRAVRERLARNRLTVPLFDTAGYTRHLESAYLVMHRRALSGEPAAGFDVPGVATA